MSDRRPYVLVGGWPGSGETTTARALTPALGLAYLGKDELKESLMEQFGRPADVSASRRLGEAAVRILLRLARDCPGAVVDRHLDELNPGVHTATPKGALVLLDRPPNEPKRTTQGGGEAPADSVPT